MDIGLAIKRTRKAKGMTQIDLANKAGMSASGIGQIETNKKIPHKKSIIKITKALDMDATDLLKAVNKIAKDKRDITGQRFGKLTAIEEVEGCKEGESKWICKCECGNFKTVRMNSLKTGNTKSCGCIAHEARHEFCNKLWKAGKLDDARNADRFKGTKIGKLRSKKKYKSNTSGIRGVSWNKQKSKWEAYIQAQGEYKKLGLFDKIEDAAKARKEAEEKYFKPLIEEFHEIQGGA